MYGKLFAQMFDGTLATRGPWQALVTFQQLIVLANRHGEVDMTAEALSRRTTIPLEIIEVGLERLMEPDPQSRSPDQQGRRIVPLDAGREWGWRIVNYEHYRRIRSEDERREYWREWKREARKKDVQERPPPSTKSIESIKSSESTNSRGRGISRSKGTTLPEASPLVPSSDSVTVGIEAQVPAKSDTGPAVAGATWDAYSMAYRGRYGVEPVRNAKANALMHALVKRIGAEAPQVAAFYLAHNRAIYVNARHAPELLVRDCEGLRTQWATGVKATPLEARSAEQLDSARAQLVRLTEGPP